MASKEGNIFKRITGAVEHPLVRGFAGAGIKLVEEGVELAGKRMRAQVKNLSSKSPEAEPVLTIGLEERKRRQQERQEKMKLAWITAELRELRPEGREINKKIVEAVFLGPNVLRRYSMKEQNELRARYEGKSFLDLGPDNQMMFVEALVDYES